MSKVMSFNEECERIALAAAASSNPDYYRASEFRELAGRYAGQLINLAAEVTRQKYIAGTTEQAMAVLELASGDDLSDTGVAHLADILLKFLADRSKPCAWAGRGLSVPSIAKSISEHMKEACELDEITRDLIRDPAADRGCARYHEMREAA